MDDEVCIVPRALCTSEAHWLGRRTLLTSPIEHGNACGVCTPHNYAVYPHLIIHFPRSKTKVSQHLMRITRNYIA